MEQRNESIVDIWNAGGINMPGYELTEKQKSVLKRMNADAQKYEQESMTEFQLEQFNHIGTMTLGPIAEQNEIIAQKLKEQMMVDQDSALQLKEAYPDLYDQAQNEMIQLNEQANISGSEKIKNDFWGRKKRGARAKIRQIKTSRDELEEKRYEEQGRKYIKMFEEARTRNEQALERDKENKTLLSEKQRLNIQGYTLTYSTAADIVYKLTPHAQAINSKQKILLAKKYRTAAGKENMFSANMLYRDMASYTTALGRGVDANVDEMEKHAKNVYIICNKETIEGDLVSNEQQMKAYREEIPVVTKSYEECLDFFKSHPELTKNQIAPSAIMLAFDEIQLLYKKTQVVTYVMREMMKPELFWQLTPQEQQLVSEMRQITTVANLMSHDLYVEIKQYENSTERESFVEGATVEEYIQKLPQNRVPQNQAPSA